MEKKVHQLGNRGMMRDTSISKRDNEHAYENLNIRLTAVEKDTLLTVTNEKGTVDTGLEIPGQYLAHCVIGDDIVVFSKGDKDYISLIGVKDYRENGDSKPSKTYNDLGIYNLYSGNLNFSMEHPMDTLANIETTDCRKVYWVDGINPNRFIDICRNYVYEVEGVDTQFDFMPSFLCEQDFGEEFAVVDKDYSGSGLMPGGIIQYFLTFFNKRGAETDIIWASPRVMPSFQDRGASPEELTPTRFIITVNCNHIDFEYARLYAYHQTSQDAQGNAYIVADMDVKEDGIVFIDNGTNHTDIDPSQLLFLGGQEFSAETITQKSGKMFLGNITYPEAENIEHMSETIKKYFFLGDTDKWESKAIQFIDTNYSRNTTRNNKIYPYTPTLEPTIRTFKGGEKYRFGIQFIKANGSVSRTWWIGDKINNIYPHTDNNIMYHSGIVFTMPDGFLSDSNVKDYLKQYKSYRIMYVIPSDSDRLVKAQGFLSPTVFNVGDRVNGNTYGISSWFTRPFNSSVQATHYSVIHNEIQSQQTDKSVIDDKVEFKTYKFKFKLECTASVNPDGKMRVSTVELKMEKLSGSIVINTKYYGYGSIYSGKFVDSTSVISQVLYDFPELNFNISNIRDWLTDADNHFTRGSLRTALIIENNKVVDFVDAIAGSYGDRNVVNTLNVTVVSKIMESNPELYCIDESLVTMHTPDINATLTENLKLRIIGVTSLNWNLFSKSMKVTNPYGSHAGLDDVKVDSNEITTRAFLWKDSQHKVGFDAGGVADSYLEDEMESNADTSYMIYMWHKTGSIVDYTKDGVIYSKLTEKTFANESIYGDTLYLKHGDADNSMTYEPEDIIKILDAGSVMKNGNLFMKDVDKIIPLEKDNDGSIKSYDVETSHSMQGEVLVNSTKTKDAVRLAYNSEPLIVIQNKDILPRVNDETEIIHYKDPVNDYYLLTNNLNSPSLKKEDNGYWIDAVTATILKSFSYDKVCAVIDNEIRLIHDYELVEKDTHYILVLNNSELLEWERDYNKDTVFMLIPEYGYYSVLNNNGSLTFNYVSDIEVYDNLNIKIDGFNNKSYLFIGELYRDADTRTDYGGIGDEQVLNNVFVPISSIVPLSNPQTYNNDADTWYQRFDCMVAKPRTNDDENQVMSITSVMLETHVNLDARYDTKRYQTDLLTLNPENYAPVNMAYSSTGNIITSSTLDDRFNVGDYPAMIAHSFIKEPNALVDTWTNITLAATDSLDSANGELSALRTYNGNILAFQDKAISQILYDERTQLATNIGVPIEVANSSTVSHATITTNYGCSDRRAIVGTKSGVFFYDRFNGILARYGDGFQALSSIKGFDIWFRSHNQKYRLFYDNKHGDIYMNNDDQETLCYNEYLDEFTSFYTYGKVDMMENIRDHFYSLNGSKLWENGAGKYNSLYGNTVGFHTIYKVTPDPYGDKIFTNLDYRADFFNGDEYLTGVTFDKILTGDEYQQSEMIPGKQKRPSINTARQKFRLWKMDIPRVKIPGKGLPQWLRNPWMQLELRKENPENMRMEFHNLNVIYYE